MTETSVQIPIFVISLARAVERRAAITAHLQRFGLSYTLIEATDGALLSRQEIDRLLAPGVQYVPGVVGCYMSHIGVYRRVVDEGLPLALVLEDDAVLNPRLVPFLKGAVFNTDYDYCLLDCDDCSEDTIAFYNADSRQMLVDGFPIYETNVGPALLHAYLITQSGAAKRLQQAWPIVKPVDVYSHLSDQPRILVCVDPKGAAASENSRQSFTSSRHDQSPFRLRALRSHPGFYKLRDLLKLRPLRRRLLKQRLIQAGLLPREGRWMPLPSGRNITYW